MAAPNGLIVAWPSTVASIPGGWTRVAGLNDKHPKASATAGTTGGNVAHTHPAASHQHADTHSHAAGTIDTDTGGGTATQGLAGTNGTFGHSHSNTSGAASYSVDAASGTTSSVSEVLSTTTVIFLTSDGSTDIPSGAVMWWNTSSAPTNWAYADGSAATPDLRNKYLLGATAGADGNSSVGAASHQHTYSHSHGSTNNHSHGLSGTSGTGGSGVTGAGSINSAASPHTHTGGSTSTDAVGTGTDATTSDAQTTEPPFYKLLPIKKTGADAALPAGIIGWWVGGAAPSGWTLANGTNGSPNLNGNSYFIKGAATTGEIATTGGTANHTHNTNHAHSVSAHTHAGGGGGSTSGPSATATMNAGLTTFGTSTTTHTHTGGSSGAMSGSPTTNSTGQSYTANTSNDPAFSTTIYIQMLAHPPTVTGVNVSSGPVGGGTAVTITGTGFQNLAPGTNTVTFNGVAATGVSVSNDTTITCTTGGGASPGLGNVVVTNNNGTGTGTNLWTYVSSGSPNVHYIGGAVMRAATR